MEPERCKKERRTRKCEWYQNVPASSQRKVYVNVPPLGGMERCVKSGTPSIKKVPVCLMPCLRNGAQRIRQRCLEGRPQRRPELPSIAGKQCSERARTAGRTSAWPGAGTGS